MSERQMEVSAANAKFLEAVTVGAGFHSESYSANEMRLAASTNLQNRVHLLKSYMERLRIVSPYLDDDAKERARRTIAGFRKQIDEIKVLIKEESAASRGGEFRAKFKGAA